MKLLIIVLLFFLLGILVGSIYIYKIMDNKLNKKIILNRKFQMMYQMMERWIYCIHENKEISNYLGKNNIKKIAIYGCGDIGKLLYANLKNSNIIVEYGIDKNVRLEFPVPIKSIQDVDDNVDAIIVTSIAYFYEIEESLKKITKSPILSLEDIIYEIAY